jgi:hypothetical protein
MVVAFGGALLAGIPQIGEAQCSGASCTVSITMPVGDVMRMTLSATNSALGTPGESDFTAGFRDVSGSSGTVTVKANRAFRVQVSGGSTLFSYSGSLANPSKPASDLVWAATAAGRSTSTNNLGATGTLLSASATAGTAQSIFLRTKWAFNRDVPGTYSVNVVLTLTAP